MDALYAQLAEAIEKSNKSYDLPRIEAAYELAKRRMRVRYAPPAIRTSLTPLQSLSYW